MYLNCKNETADNFVLLQYCIACVSLYAAGTLKVLTKTVFFSTCYKIPNFAKNHFPRVINHVQRQPNMNKLLFYRKSKVNKNILSFI